MCVRACVDVCDSDCMYSGVCVLVGTVTFAKTHLQMPRPMWDGTTPASSHCKCVPTALGGRGHGQPADKLTEEVWDDFCHEFHLPAEAKIREPGTVWPTRSRRHGMGVAPGHTVPLQPTDMERGILAREAEIQARAIQSQVTVATWTDWANANFPGDMASAIRAIYWMPSHGYPAEILLARDLYLLEDYHRRERAMADFGNVGQAGHGPAASGHGPAPGGAAGSAAPAGPGVAAAGAAPAMANRGLVTETGTGSHYDMELGSIDQRVRYLNLTNYGHEDGPSGATAVGGGGVPGVMVMGNAAGTGNGGSGNGGTGAVAIGGGSGTTNLPGDGSGPQAMPQSSGAGGPGAMGMGGTSGVAMSGGIGSGHSTGGADPTGGAMTDPARWARQSRSKGNKLPR